MLSGPEAFFYDYNYDYNYDYMHNYGIITFAIIEQCAPSGCFCNNLEEEIKDFREFFVNMTYENKSRATHPVRNRLLPWLSTRLYIRRRDLPRD